MNEILNMNTEGIAGLAFDCSCGRKHSVGINKIIIETGALSRISEAASHFKQGKILIIADNNTYSVCGARVEEILRNDGFNVTSYIFISKHDLIPDEKAFGRLVLEVKEDISLIVAVGSGSINDLSRMASYKLKIPYIIVATAPSMDGYASTVSPLIVGGTKVTLDAVYPYAIVADMEILKNAPMHMIHAGFGDIIGKLTALTDWELSRRLNGEYYCETTITLVKSALKKCSDNAENIANRQENGIRYLMEALVLSGVAIGLVGNSRPASGAEHHTAHYWEVDAIAKGLEHPLHGNSVGVGAVVISMLYEMMKDKLPDGMEIPKTETVVGLLDRVGAIANPAKLGITKELFRNSVLHAKEIRPRFTIYNFTDNAGMLEKMADILTERFYG